MHHRSTAAWSGIALVLVMSAAEAAPQASTASAADSEGLGGARLLDRTGAVPDGNAASGLQALIDLQDRRPGPPSAHGSPAKPRTAAATTPAPSQTSVTARPPVPTHPSGLFGTELNAEAGQHQTLDPARRQAVGQAVGVPAPREDAAGVGALGTASRPPPLWTELKSGGAFLRAHRVEAIVFALAGALLWWAGALLVRRIRTSY
jgi:hypothetical protein